MGEEAHEDTLLAFGKPAPYLTAATTTGRKRGGDAGGRLPKKTKAAAAPPTRSSSQTTGASAAPPPPILKGTQSALPTPKPQARPAPPRADIRSSGKRKFEEAVPVQPVPNTEDNLLDLRQKKPTAKRKV